MKLHRLCVLIFVVGTISISARIGVGGEASSSGACRVAKERAKTMCHPDAGFLCVNTPEGGYAASSFRLQGTIDREHYGLASMHIAVQHDYTKKTQQIDTSSFEKEDCWAPRSAAPFCIDGLGHFSASIPLLGSGPHTITVTATRLSGSSEHQTVFTSRVQPFALDAQKIEFSPDVRTTPKTDARMVEVTVSLLGDCAFCDFIGASTGGISVAVMNSIEEGGRRREVTCATSIEQQGQGRFHLGVPVFPGKNTFTISACNAASASPPCPQAMEFAFDVNGSDSSFEILSPPPQPSYASTAFPTIPFRFRLPGSTDACVDVALNFEHIQSCRDQSGVYSADLHPRIGINIATAPCCAKARTLASALSGEFSSSSCLSTIWRPLTPPALFTLASNAWMPRTGSLENPATGPLAMYV